MGAAWDQSGQLDRLLILCMRDGGRDKQNCLFNNTDHLVVEVGVPPCFLTETPLHFFIMWPSMLIWYTVIKFNNYFLGIASLFHYLPPILSITTLGLVLWGRGI